MYPFFPRREGTLVCIGRGRQLGNMQEALRTGPGKQKYEGYKRSQTVDVRYTGDLEYSWQYLGELSTTG